ncbi:hypothetical protein [Fibrobacter intestinalis]|uniref:Uncharacterized protein n=1 Tax=Fibrobacter intestinalis TaxID=28122 RepID=A0A1T4NTB2_9BACT|nr:MULTISPECIES: hypothetical protein [Fibrobacter]PBC73264.1 hypothetical protein BGW94_0864 [Fibrobacter sp. NR9]SJZ82484.1 hypothetical protein SAMN02745108_01701 [Fibrobacter intestinalis]
MIGIIQFPHPHEEEYSKNITNGIKRWNDGRHKRNFILSADEAITAKGAKPQRFESISFWGEWEPEAEVVKTFDKNSPAKRLIKPLFPQKMPVPRGTKCCANTDPFVFGEHFKYSNCRQCNKNGVVKTMQTLSAGSLILFGSVVYEGRLPKKEFLLDTVFVTKDKGHQFVANPYRSALQSVLNLNGADADFEAATLKPLALSSGASTFTLYQGQTYQENQEFFSFVPCKENGEAFEKVKLTPDIVPGLTACAQNYSILGKSEKDGSNSREIWSAIVDYVLSLGLSLGVRFNNIGKPDKI